MRVMIFGTFDDLHPGHTFLIGEAQKRGDLTVVVAQDANVQRIKGRPPIESQEHRMAAIQSAFPSAHVVLGDAEDFLKVIRDHNPDLLLFGYDQKLPPSIAESDIDVPIERLPAFEPEVHKSSLRRKES